MSSQTPTTVVDQREQISLLRRFVEAAMDVSGSPGLALAVAVGGRVLAEEGFGTADLAGCALMPADARFPVASITKMYTATAVMQLLERGVLRLDAPVRQYLPKLALDNPLGERDVTAYDLLTHRSGLATDLPAATLGPPVSLERYLTDAYAQDRITAYSGAAPRWADKVGARFQYSNLGIATLGYLIEACNPERLSYTEYLRRHIFRPLGMRATTVADGGGEPAAAGVGVPSIARGYAQFGDSYLASPSLTAQDYPATGLVTTAGDHLRFLLAFARYRLLRQTSVNLMIARHAPVAYAAADPGKWCGLSVEVSGPTVNPPYFGHGGASAWGWWCDSRVYPGLDLAVVAFTNSLDMISWHNPGMPSLTSVVCEFAAHLVAGRAGAQLRETDRSWCRSFLIGVLWSERMRGLLGVDADIAADAAPVTRVNRSPEIWDSNGFSAGVSYVRSQGSLTLPTARRLLSPSGHIPPAHWLNLVYRGLGGLGTPPIPLEFW